MMRCYRKLTKPLMALGLVGFVGQFLLVCCGAIAADASVLSRHCHEDAQTVSQQHHHIPTAVMDSEPHCIEHEKAMQTQACCRHVGADQAVASQQLEKNTLQVDFVEILIGLVPLPRNIVVIEIPYASKSERSRSSPPIYLANCTFLE